MTINELRALLNDPQFNADGTVLLHDIDGHEYHVLALEKQTSNDGDLVFIVE